MRKRARSELPWRAWYVCGRNNEHRAENQPESQDLNSSLAWLAESVVCPRGGVAKFVGLARLGYVPDAERQQESSLSEKSWESRSNHPVQTGFLPNLQRAPDHQARPPQEPQAAFACLCFRLDSHLIPDSGKLPFSATAFSGHCFGPIPAPVSFVASAFTVPSVAHGGERPLLPRR